jgi:glycosyltransferase involved in cell wall biosynthesis
VVNAYVRNVVAEIHAVTQPIRVLHITYDMRIGGTEMVIKNIIEGQDPSATEMLIFCIEEPLGPWGIDLQKSGINITLKHRRDGFDVSMIKAIRQCIVENKIDIVHCHQYTPWVYGALAAVGKKTKVIFTEHGRFHPDSSSWKRKLINPLLLSITDSVTAISAATKQALADYEFIPSKYSQVIYNGISPKNIQNESKAAIREKLALAPSTFILGTIARLDPIKNHLMMVNSLKLCIEQGLDLHLIIVGDGETRNEIEALVEELDLAKYVTITGYLKDPTEYLNSFDLYLLTSFSEGTSMTLLEAMSIGLACVVTDVGGNPEIIKHEENGLVVASDDAIALSHAITLLCKNPERLSDFASSSLSRFRDNFSQDIMSTNYSVLYKSLLGLDTGKTKHLR